MMKLSAILATAGIVAGGVAIGSAPASASPPVKAAESICGAYGGTWMVVVGDDDYICGHIPDLDHRNRLVQAYYYLPGWKTDGVGGDCTTGNCFVVVEQG